MTYVILIYSSRAPGAAIPAAEDQRALAAHRALQADLSAAAGLRMVARLDELTTARTIRARAAGHEVVDGPYMETKEWLVGFYVIDCADERAAIEHGRRIADRDHAIEVRPITWSRRG